MADRDGKKEEILGKIGEANPSLEIKQWHDPKYN